MVLRQLRQRDTLPVPLVLEDKERHAAHHQYQLEGGELHSTPVLRRGKRRDALEAHTRSASPGPGVLMPTWLSGDIEN
jgi:hypothetical protein